MINYLKKGINFIKKNPTILYSLLLIILIPLTLYYNLFFAVNSFQKNINYELQTKALMVESIFGIFASDIFKNPEALQVKIEKITKENPEIAKIQVILPEEEKFKIVASKEPQEIGKEISATSIDLAWSKNQAIANLTAENGERFWNVVKPFSDPEGKNVGLVNISMSLKVTDLLVLKIVRNSYIILISAILLSLFLIIHHTQLFKYPVLVKKLREIDRMKDEFIRMAIHELQSPIINIKAYTEHLKEEISDLLTGEQKESFSRISISVKNLSDLIYDMVEVSRIEQGRLDFTSQKISPSKLITDVIEEYKIKAAEKNLQLIFKEKKEPYLINVNPHRFKQILRNLIENAIKYTKKGEIEISTQPDEVKRKYFISIRDTGIGISASAQKRLFEKFYRVKTKETAGIPGTGLGLWIAKEVCKRLGGDILVESMEGVGSKFTISLPLVK